ncbi:hypothetical protein NMD99_00430 [Wolbachia endosymbiont of Listronotus oregonensis]|uniref:hypothetical protein n=1 Tax=unclassified Wolbachia TaxID=2640676 RepID=UPI0028167F45|nr:hypothetical protein [Wolbachia endosymbiont of Listronotus oregonensis]WMT84541.1 hypothetical protein NMD99_00430 [Wolbachia endosymbiont of Listronotus oregonensis]
MADTGFFMMAVLDTGIQPFTVKDVIFNIRLVTFVLTNLISNQNFWIQVVMALG